MARRPPMLCSLRGLDAEASRRGSGIGGGGRSTLAGLGPCVGSRTPGLCPAEGHGAEPVTRGRSTGQPGTPPPPFVTPSPSSSSRSRPTWTASACGTTGSPRSRTPRSSSGRAGLRIDERDPHRSSRSPPFTTKPCGRAGEGGGEGPGARMRGLDLSHNALTGLEALCALPRLEDLDLTGNWVRPPPPGNMAAGSGTMGGFIRLVTTRM